MFGASPTKNFPKGDFGSVAAADKRRAGDLTKTDYKTSMVPMYKTNGGGRDTYIYNDNGGHNSMYSPRK